MVCEEKRGVIRFITSRSDKGDDGMNCTGVGDGGKRSFIGGGE